MRMNCFGDKVSSLHCKIVLLDEQQLVHEVLATTTGQDVLNVVYQHLGPNLFETAYFGLRYVDASHQPQWLDPNKRVLQQLKGAASQSLYFAVKFYAVDPCKLVEELTRYQFFLQIKKDILQGRLPVTTELAAELAALAIQSELGDYDPHRHQPGYVSEFRFLAHQSPDLETKIAELHKTMRGMVPAVAEMRYLERVKWLDLYGSDLHPVLGEDTVEYFLGLTPSGIVVLRNKTKVGNYFWPRISKIHFKGRYFMLRVRDKSNDESTYGFETPSKGACKSLYKCCSQHLAFFRLVQMSGPLANAATTMTSGSNNNKYLRLSGAVAVTAPAVGGQSRSSPPQFRRMPSRRHQRRIVDNGASHPPQVDECSTSDSDKTLDAASTATLLSPYHSKGNETTQRVPRSSDTWTEASSVRSRRSRSHSRSRKECRSNSVDSTESRSHHRRKGHRSRSRHNSDNESEVSRVSETSNRTGSRRRRHRSSRDSSGSESENQSSQHRSHRRNKRRGSQGSTYELVDSEAQWREIQERQGQKQQMQTATAILPAAFSSPAQMQQQGVPQQATVRKASASLTSPSSNSSLLDQSNGELMMSTETASQASSRHRQHRKHHHRHSHKHRSHSRSGEKNSKSALPTEIMPHLQYQLVEPPADSTADQLREIPYQQVVTGPPANLTKSSTVTKETAKDSANIPGFTDSLSRKRHRALHPLIYPEERKIISVDNDSPPPPYSPPQNADSLAQTLAALSLPPPSRPRTRGSESALHNNPSGPQQQHSTMSQASVNPPSVTARPVVPVPGPKPVGLKSNIPSVPPSVAPRPVHLSNTNINGSLVNGNAGGSHHLSNGRQYHQPGSAVHNPSTSNKGFYNGNVEQYQHQDNRRVMNMPQPQQANGNISSAYNGFHYSYPIQQQMIPNNNSLAPNPHHVGLPLSGFVPNHSTPSTQVQGAGSQQQQNTQNSAAPLTLPGMNGNSRTTTGLIHHNTSVPEKSKSMMPLSPLANGVTVTNQMQSQTHAQDTLSRSTKYVTRPQTPVTQKTFVMSAARSDTIPYPPSHQQPNMNHKTMTLPHRSQQRTRTADKFAIQPPPTFAYNDNVTTWHASLPRLIRHIPAPQTGNSTIRYESTLPLTETETTKPRRASSLELILSPMIESTLQRKKRAL